MVSPSVRMPSPHAFEDMKTYPATPAQLKSLSIMAREATANQKAALKQR